MPEIELDNDIEVTFTIFKNEYTVDPIKVATPTFSKFISVLSVPHIGAKNSNCAFVGGEVRHSRNNANTISRSLLTVDIDDIPADVDLYSEISSRFY